MAYLRALPAAEREARRPRMIAGTGAITILGGGERGEPFVLTFQATSTAMIAREGEPLVFPERTRRREVRWERAPVSGISFDDARAYAAWLAGTGRIPGARLCSDVEWERAARGADGRTWPQGDRLDIDDANIDETYDRQTLAYGPDEVGMHPRSNSPFGVVDAAGNALEWVAGPSGAVVQRGGSWWHTAATAESANRDLTDPSLRLWWLGTRICADAP
jgi:formylglycine-generating enzyme required for sulfatase activity